MLSVTLVLELSIYFIQKNKAEWDTGSLNYSKLQVWFTSALICLMLVELHKFR